MRWQRRDKKRRQRMRVNGASVRVLLRVIKGKAEKAGKE